MNITSHRRHHAVRALCCAAVLAATTIAADAQGPLTTIEECLESGLELVTLPASPGGTLAASECRGCATQRLAFAGDTRYFIGNRAVSYARLREAAGQRPAHLYICYRPSDRTLTRLLLSAAASQ